MARKTSPRREDEVTKAFKKIHFHQQTTHAKDNEEFGAKNKATTNSRNMIEEAHRKRKSPILNKEKAAQR